MKELYLRFADTRFQNELLEVCALKNIQWHFNVYQISLHRVIGLQSLTYEEFYTLLCKTEAVLNSRPLVQIMDDPSNDYVSPAHFLIGGPFTSTPMDLDPSVSLLRRWKLIRQLCQHFWSRWQREYLHTLNQKLKWQAPTQNLSVGDLVLIYDKNSSPL